MLEHELRQAIAKDPRGVIIIVGAGVTLGALAGTEHQARASWSGLIRDGLEYAVAHGRLDPADGDRLRGLLESKNADMWILAAERLTTALDGPTGGDFKAWLRRSVGALADSIRERSVLDPLVELSRLGATIATVNYDGVLEEATGLTPVTWRQPSRVERVLRRDERGILHFHGYWEDPTSIVLGCSSYGEVVRDEHARAVLEGIRLFHTLVFVGHGAGLSDPNWGSFLAWTAQVYRGSEYPHYRIAREAELAELRTSELQAQRISLVGYKGGHENLGPFLKTLVPTSTSTTPVVERETPAPSTDKGVAHLLLLLEIGEHGHEFASVEDVEASGLLPPLAAAPLCMPRRVLDYKTAKPADWRTIAEDLDALLARASATAREIPGPVCLVIAGIAPLPAMAYLGYQSKRQVGQVLILNRDDQAQWQKIGPYGGAADFPGSLRELFTFDAPQQFHADSGVVALFVGCSKIYQCSPKLLESVTVDEARQLRAIYRVTTDVDHKETPLTAGDLRHLHSLVTTALTKTQQECSASEDLVFAFGGPMWVAFWLARLLNSRVFGNITFPNFVKGKGYVRALAAQMWRQRLVTVEPRILFLAAEPDDTSRTRAGAQLTAIGEAVEAGQGHEARHRIHTVPSTTVDKLVALLDRERPDILHVYAHGGVDGSLALENDRGDARAVPPERFLAALRSAGVRPVLTVACACNSAALAPGLLELSHCVVVVNSTVPYKQATSFMGGFYRALAEGRSVAEAFAQGEAHAGVVLDPDKQPFELLPKEGVDHGLVYFWRPTS